MHLGVVMLGVGAQAGACIGVLEALSARGIEPFAVCGLGTAAWPAALHCAGMDAAAMMRALGAAAHMGRRLLDSHASARRMLRGKGNSLLEGRRIDALLCAQAGEKPMALCARQGVFLCRSARSGRRMIFTTQAYAQDSGALMSMQAPLCYAARASMAMPPYLPPVSWMGCTLLPEGDAGFACRQLLAMGAQRVLVVNPRPSSAQMDALDLTGLQMQRLDELPPASAVLRVQMPKGSLSLDALPICARAGHEAADSELDGIFARMGMAQGRVLPFRVLR